MLPGRVDGFVLVESGAVPGNVDPFHHRSLGYQTFGRGARRFWAFFAEPLGLSSGGRPQSQTNRPIAADCLAGRAGAAMKIGSRPRRTTNPKGPGSTLKEADNGK